MTYLRSARQLFSRSVGYQRGMLIAGSLLTALVLIVALFAPLIAPYGYATLRDKHGYFGAQHHPSAHHLFGTTVGGFDVFSRVVWGAQTALEVIVAGTVVALILGTALGLVSGYIGGWLDGLFVMVADAIYAFPPLLLAIVMSIVISGGESGRWSGIFSAAVTVTIVFIPQYFRVVRAETVRLKHEPFVESAKVIGVPRTRILARHVLRNATRTLPLIFTLNAGSAVMTLAGLGFVGFGIDPTAAAEWGYDLNRALSDISSGIWWTSIYPGAAIVLTVLGITLLGESINDLHDPKLRRRSGARRDLISRLRTLRDRRTAGEDGVVVASDDLLMIEHLNVSFVTDGGLVTAVDDVSLSVRRGEILAVVGESGSGKTVTAKTILGLLPETAQATGRVVVGNHNVLAVSRRLLRQIRGRDAAMIFQEPSSSLNPVFTVGWQIGEGLRAHGKISRKAVKARAIELLRSVGIPDPEHRVDHYPHQFSGGQQQRVVIAMALALNAPLIVADEPTTALDVTVQAGILELLRDLRDEYGTSVVLITHNMGVVADLADRVAVMHNGKIVEQADTITLFQRPQEEYTRALLAAVPRIGRARPPVPPITAEILVEAKELVVEYPGRLGQGPFRAVDRVSFQIAQGEVLGLVGESGSGKSTIARAIAGLAPASAGSLIVLDVEMVGLRERSFRQVRKNIGFVFQDPATSFNPKLTIAECVAEPIAVHESGSAADVRRRVDALLESVQLTAAHGMRYPHELSGGQRQRASLARALALRPKLLIADEPTSALDVSVQDRVLELFRELQRELGFAVMFISHDLAVVDALADRIGVLYQARLVEQGSRYDVLTSPQDDYTKRLLGASPVPDPVEQARRRAGRRAAEALS
jgi:peptide/nickel transport system ATP-binding protein